MVPHGRPTQLSATGSLQQAANCAQETRPADFCGIFCLWTHNSFLFWGLPCFWRSQPGFSEPFLQKWAELRLRMKLPFRGHRVWPQLACKWHFFTRIKGGCILCREDIKSLAASGSQSFQRPIVLLTTVMRERMSVHCQRRDVGYRRVAWPILLKILLTQTLVLTFLVS